jgi:hypothetical protein
MSRFKILTQTPVVIDFSRPAMEFISAAIENGTDCTLGWTPDVQCELDNFRNLLQNLLERSEPETGNMDLIGG